MATRGRSAKKTANTGEKAQNDGRGMTGGDDRIVLRFHWNEDLMRNNARLILKGQRWRVFRALAKPRTAVAFVIVLVIGAALAPDQRDLPAFFPGLALGLLAAFAAFYLTADAQSWALHEIETEMRSQRGEAVVTLSAEGAEMRQGDELYALKWPAVTRVEEFGKGFMIFTTIFRGVPVPDEALPEGISRADAMRRVAEWRG